MVIAATRTPTRAGRASPTPGNSSGSCSATTPPSTPAPYATCVYNPAKALCRQQHDAHGIPRPSLGSCQPLECRNTALTADNKAALRREAGQISRQLAAGPVLPPLLQARLAERRDQIDEFLGRYPDRP
jgi:hypothetical protein